MGNSTGLLGPQSTLALQPRSATISIFTQIIKPGSNGQPKYQITQAKRAKSGLQRLVIEQYARGLLLLLTGYPATRTSQGTSQQMPQLRQPQKRPQNRRIQALLYQGLKSKSLRLGIGPQQSKSIRSVKNEPLTRTPQPIVVRTTGGQVKSSFYRRGLVGKQLARFTSLKSATAT